MTISTPDTAETVPDTPVADTAAPIAVRVIKKYPNRRLYDTAASAYITLAQVKELVMQFVPFCVRDAKTGEDLTRSILLQIILEEEAGGTPLFNTPVLSNIIRFYGHAMQGMFMHNLENTIQMFSDMQQQMMQMAQANPQQTWQQMMQAPVQNMQHMQEQVQEQMQHMQQVQEKIQRQYMEQWQNWLYALQPRR